MATNLAVLALAVALGAAVASGYVLMQDGAAPPAEDARVTALSARVARMEETLSRLAAEDLDAPRLVGRSADPSGKPDAVGQPGAPGASGAAIAAARPSAEDLPEGEAGAAIEEMVDKAVEKKAAQLQRMRTNKKPSIDVFSETLELSEEERRAAERDVVQAQHELVAILEMETADGAVLMDELVETLAQSMASPEKNAVRWQRFVGHLLTEEVPGTGQTYAIRLEAVKKRLRDTFKRDWSDKQYKTFESWQMDPTEVQGIPGSPWKDIEVRVLERARALGVEIPETD